MRAQPCVQVGPTRAWADIVESAIRTALVILIAFYTLISPGVVLRFVDVHQPRAALGLILLLTTLIAMVVIARTWRHREAGSWLVLATAITGLGLSVPATRIVPELADTWWPTQLMVTTGSFLTLARPRRGWVPAGILLSANVLLRWNTWTESPVLPELTRPLAVLVETGQLVALTASAWVVGTLCRRAARQVDAVRAESEAARAASLRRQNEAWRSEEVDRFVHDEILHGLRILAMTGAATTREQSRDVARRLGQAAGSTDGQEVPTEVGGFLRSLGDDVPIDVVVRGPHQLSVPGQVHDAIRAASREAVRNVAQHSGAGRADVDVRVRGLVLAVEIRDEGRGFDVPSSERRGLTSSIEARMRDVGGAAVIASQPGHRTQVRLTWSPVGEADPALLGAGMFNEFFPWLVLVGLPRLSMGLWFPALLAGQFEHGGSVAVASVVLVVCGTLAAVQGLRRCQLTAWASAAVIAVMWLTTGINGLLLPHGAAHPRLMWVPGAAAALISLLSIYRPLKEAVVAGIGLMAITAATTAQMVGTWPDWTPYLLPTAAPVITLVLAVAVRRGAEQMAWEIVRAEHDSATAEAQAAAKSFEQRLVKRLSIYREPLRALLADATRLSPEADASGIRNRAENLDQALREELMLGDSGALRTAVANAREAGVQVRVRLASGMPPDVAQSCATALRHIPPDALDQADVTALAAGTGWRLSLMLTPVPADGVQTALRASGWRITELDHCLLARQELDGTPGQSPIGATGATPSQAGKSSP